MTDSMAELIQRVGHDQIATGVVEDISPDGVAMVVLSGEEHSREASSLLHFASASAASEALLGRTVLVLQSRQSQLVILGVVSQRLWEKRDGDDSREGQGKLPVDGPLAVQLDKKKKCLDLEASDEIRLTCGKSSLVMRRDGTVVVRGVTITTRATQANKIRGATVSLN